MNDEYNEYYSQMLDGGNKEEAIMKAYNFLKDNGFTVSQIEC